VINFNYRSWSWKRNLWKGQSWYSYTHWRKSSCQNFRKRQNCWCQWCRKSRSWDSYS